MIWNSWFLSFSLVVFPMSALIYSWIFLLFSYRLYFTKFSVSSLISLYSNDLTSSLVVCWITLCCVGSLIISFSGIVASFMCSGGYISLLLMISTCYIFADLMLYWFYLLSSTSPCCELYICVCFLAYVLNVFFQGFLAFLVICITQIYVTQLLLNK